MTSNEIREKFLKFFEKKGHKIMPSSSLIPDDQSVLFTTAGMQQFKPYYLNPELAERDLGSKNIVTVQKCVRTGDIDEVGDNTHLTFFEMLGNFSFGGYGRKEAIEYAYEFITKEMKLEISYVTVYEGSHNVPKDEESKKIWENLGIKNIKEEGTDVFWGPTGESGPCGPTTEIYCKNASDEDVEIWNIVFNEYSCDGSREKLDKGEAKLKKLPVLGIDTGMGLERLVTVVNKYESVYDTDLFNGEKTKEERIIADHIKASLFIISNGVTPSNTGAGYVLRKLIRRMMVFSKNSLENKINKIREIYKGIYILKEKGEIVKEEEKFKQAVTVGVDVVNRIVWDTSEELGKKLANIYQVTGMNFELSIEVLEKKRGEKFNEKKISEIRKIFNEEMEKHQDLSRTSSAGMFKGGLANNSEKTIRLHTAHHLLLAGLQEIVSKDIKQKGSNITEERLRMDFMYDRKLTDEEKKKVEDWVNDKIQKGLNVVRKEMPLAEAEKIGAQMEFGAKYPDVVSVYFIEDKNGNAISKEFCGGPHVTNTSELATNPDGMPKHFKIQKEEASSAGVRRIKAVLE